MTRVQHRRRQSARMSTGMIACGTDSEGVAVSRASMAANMPYLRCVREEPGLVVSEPRAVSRLPTTGPDWFKMQVNTTGVLRNAGNVQCFRPGSPSSSGARGCAGRADCPRVLYPACPAHFTAGAGEA